MVKNSGFLIGCDPELFVVDKDGTPVSAYNMVPGTKAEPHKVEKGAIQVDGMALEFNIDPADNFEDFNNNIVTVVRQLKSFIPKDHKFLIAPHVRFSDEVFDAQPEEAVELGCEPDFNAWAGGAENPRPVASGENRTLRTASGHIHIGWDEGMDIQDEQHRNCCADLVKQLDFLLGFPSTKHDSESTRRLLYGKAGAHRIKSYGVEYRVLSNFWIASKERRRWVWDRTQEAINTMASYEWAKKLRGAEVIVMDFNEGQDFGSLRRYFNYRYPMDSIVLDRGNLIYR